MPRFAYQGQTRQGGLTYGELIAVDATQAGHLLRQQRIRVLRLREKPSLASSLALWDRRVGLQDLMVTTLQLSTLLKAGLPLAEGLGMLGAHTEHTTLRRVLDQVRQRVESGSSMGEALTFHPRVFSPWYVGMVEAGEASGRLDVILERLVSHMEKVLRMRQQVRAALVYPMTVLSVAALVLAVLLVWVIPMFEPLFRDFGDALPWPTVVVLDVSQFLQREFLWVVTGLIGCVLGVSLFLRSKSGRALWEWMILKVPVVGVLLKKMAVVHVTRTLGVLLQSGVPILEGLGIAAKTSHLSLFQQALQQARLAVRDGHPLAVPLSALPMFPRLVSQMVAVGESSGALDRTLEHVAALYEQEVDRRVLSLSTLIEPAIILVLGVGIGFIVVAMYLPIFSMASVVG